MALCLCICSPANNFCTSFHEMWKEYQHGIVQTSYMVGKPQLVEPWKMKWIHMFSKSLVFFFCFFFSLNVKNNAVGYEVPLAVNVKNVLFWDVTPYSSVDGYQCWGCRFLWNIGAGLLNCIVSHPKRLNIKECLDGTFFSTLLSHASWAKKEHALLHAFFFQERGEAKWCTCFPPEVDCSCLFACSLLEFCVALAAAFVLC